MKYELDYNVVELSCTKKIAPPESVPFRDIECGNDKNKSFGFLRKRALHAYGWGRGCNGASVGGKDLA